MSIFGRKFVVDNDHALLIIGMKKDPEISFESKWVWPIIQKAYIAYIGPTKVLIERFNDNHLICKDKYINLSMEFVVRVIPTKKDVLKVMRNIGSERMSDKDCINDLFQIRFSESIKSIARNYLCQEILNNKDSFVTEIIKHIGTSLNGYVIEDAKILRCSHIKPRDFSREQSLI